MAQGNKVTPSAEEMQKGQDAARRISTYEERKQKVKKGFIRSAVLGLAFVFCMHVMGAGLGVLILVALIWVAPKFFISFLLG